MEEQNTAQLQLDDEDVLKDRISRLEDELTRMRDSLESAERQHPKGHSRGTEMYLREVCDRTKDVFEDIKKIFNHIKEVFDQLSVCMFLVEVTQEGRFRYAGFNRAEEQAVGLSSSVVTGKFVEEVFGEDLARKLDGNYRRCVEAGTSLTYYDDLDLPKGRRYFHSNLIPLRNSAGRIHRLVGVCIDMTDFKRSQEEAMARQKLEDLGVVATSIAHDLSNLLGSILAEAELAESEMAAGSSPVPRIQTIEGIASRAGEIVRELLRYARQDETSFEPVNLSRLVGEMLQLLRASISKYAELRAELPENLPSVWANPAQIRQVVLNLLTNASEAIGDKDGLISVGISKVQREDISMPGSTVPCGQGDFLRLTVADTGIGMSEEVRQKIFDPSFTTKLRGRGLGLATVQGIIRKHSGSIRVASVPGLGSCFEILLPCMQEPAGQAE